MNIGLDYDDTYTRHPLMWDKVIDVMRKAGHKVYIVTWRSESECVEVYEALDGKVHGVYSSDRRAKQAYMYSQGILIDVWIDDNPSAIIKDMETYQSSGVWQ